MVVARRVRGVWGHDGRAGVAIIREVKDRHLPGGGVTGPAAPVRSDPRLEQARRALGELEEAEAADALAPARRLADLLEELLEGREGEIN